MAAEYAPSWLDTADVKAWLRLQASDATDDELVAASAAMTEPYVQRCRPEWAGIDVTDPENPVHVYLPDAETYQAAVMLAGRVYRRRNSPHGIEQFGDSVSFVARYDPDIERALQTGSYARPVVS
jgi:hypothetical protein